MSRSIDYFTQEFFSHLTRAQLRNDRYCFAHKTLQALGYDTMKVFDNGNVWIFGRNSMYKLLRNIGYEWQASTSAWERAQMTSYRENRKNKAFSFEDAAKIDIQKRSARLDINVTLKYTLQDHDIVLRDGDPKMPVVLAQIKDLTADPDRFEADLNAGMPITLKLSETGKLDYQYRYTSYTAENFPTSDGYWVSPKGDIYNVGFCGHSRSAEELIPRHYHTPTDKLTEYKTDYLENRGWVHISSSHVVAKLKVTDRQYDALSAIVERCADFNRAMCDSIKYEAMFKC